MRTTIRAGGMLATISGGAAGVLLTLTDRDGLSSQVKLEPHEAALLAGEIERGAWRAQQVRELRADACEVRHD